MTLILSPPSYPVCPTTATMTTYDIPDFTYSTYGQNYEIAYTAFVASSANCVVTQYLTKSDLTTSLPGTILKSMNTTHIVLNFDSSYINTVYTIALYGSLNNTNVVKSYTTFTVTISDYDGTVGF